MGAMHADTLVIDDDFKLEKFPGKGGWTYAALPDIPLDKQGPFGWLKVKGSIDGIEIKKYHLMPMDNGKLFLPVKAEIRKLIKKQAGDVVHIVLSADNEALEIPEEFSLCLRDEPEAWRFFQSLNENDQQQYIKWMYAAKTEQTKESRIAGAISRLAKHQKLNGPK